MTAERLSTNLPIGVKMVYIGHMENNTAIRDFFTDTEWDLIYTLLDQNRQYEDPEMEGIEDYDTALQKITKLFNN